MAEEELQDSLEAARRVMDLLLEGDRLINTHVSKMVARIEHAYAIAVTPEKREVPFDLTLNILGMLLALISVITSGPLLTALGVVSAGASLLDTVARQRTRAERAQETFARMRSDKAALEVFEIAEQVFAQFTAALTLSVRRSAIDDLDKNVLLNEFREWRRRWRLGVRETTQ